MRVRQTNSAVRFAGATVIAILSLVSSAAGLTDSRDLLRCQGQIDRQLQNLMKTVARQVHTCAEKVLKCNLKSELDGEDVTSCLEIANKRCAKVPLKVSSQRTKAGDRIVDKCGAIPLEDLTAFLTGLGFQDVVDECAALAAPLTPINVTTVEELVTCMLATAQCTAEREVFVRDPRAEDSLTAAAIESSFPCVGN